MFIGILHTIWTFKIICGSISSGFLDFEEGEMMSDPSKSSSGGSNLSTTDGEIGSVGGGSGSIDGGG